MLDLAGRNDESANIRKAVAASLHHAFDAEHGTLASLDRWTRRRVSDENMAKVALVLEADDPVEHCYQDLVREIDSEAQAGIYLVGQEAADADLRELEEDPGISGELHEYIEDIAPVMFADELSHSRHDMDLVWVTIRASYDRARIDAAVSALVMSHLVKDSHSGADMSFALRSMLYPFHEDVARRLAGLQRVLSDRATRELVTMISELGERVGDYASRVDAITERAAAH